MKFDLYTTHAYVITGSRQFTMAKSNNNKTIYKYDRIVVAHFTWC